MQQLVAEEAEAECFCKEEDLLELTPQKVSFSS